jgi:tetratricopeptide (TPR) repeat protein
MGVRRSLLGALLVPVSLLAAQAWAYEIEYAADRPAELRACDADLYRGRTAEARACYASLRLDSDDTRIRADAARALGDPQSANDLFKTAFAEHPDDPRVRTRWGRLFLETHEANEAVKLFQESLAIDPAYVPAIVGLAEVAAGRFEDRAREWVEDALEVDADDIAALLLVARMDLEIGALDEADARLDRALELAESREIAPLEIYALKASVDLLRDVYESEWTERSLAYNPGYGGIYATPAYFYVITRRYREAVELYRKAVEIEPDLYAAHAELGVNLLRDNKVAEAQRHLAQAYSGDPYSRPVVNTLRLIDSFDNFTVERYGKAADETSADPGIILRLHEDESEIITPHVLDLVHDSIETYTERYGFELEEPVVVELYPDHDDFAVRTSGLPGIGLLGVTFGYLVAMDSPSGRAEGDFHWGTTLWHEMAHVFTLEATDHLVPRWFSEGVSVYEEWSSGPLAGRHIPVPVLEAMTPEEDKFLPVADLDQGFIRPTYDNQIIVSYMQAGLICEYIAGRWGQQALEAMLGFYREGADTSEAIERALEITAAEFDAAFDAHVAAEFDGVLANLEAWQKVQAQVIESARSETWEEALTAGRRSIELMPDYVDEGSAYVILAKALEETDRHDEAVATLVEYHRRGGFDPGALIQLARWLAQTERTDEALEVYADILLVAPLNEPVHAAYGNLLLEAGRAEEALAEFQASFAMEPHDQAAAHFRLARAHLALESTDLAREHLLYALEIAPHYREAQQLLLEIVR